MREMALVILQLNFSSVLCLLARWMVELKPVDYPSFVTMIWFTS